jgi:ribosome biogenesis GTPase A
MPSQNIQWFPGHMARTRRLITENLKNVDAVIELLDARIPYSSRNPEISRLTAGKPTIILLNKASLADPVITKEWAQKLTNEHTVCIETDCVSGQGLSQIAPALRKLCEAKLARYEKKGMTGRSLKVMVLGIPNVGKSSFINRISGRAATKTGDRPGITQTKQWIRIAGKYELLDTPGILWPKFEDPLTARKIAYTGGIKDEIIDVEELAFFLLKFLQKYYSEMLDTRYKIENTEDFDAYDLLEEIGRKRGCMISGGNVDMMRASNLVLDDFRSARIGRISLETPPEK